MIKVLVDDFLRMACVKHLLIVLRNEIMTFQLFKTKSFHWILVQTALNKVPQIYITVLPVFFFEVV